MQFVFQDNTFCGKVHTELTTWMERRKTYGDLYKVLPGGKPEKGKEKKKCSNKQFQFKRQFRKKTKFLCKELSVKLKEEFKDFVNEYHIFHIKDISQFMVPDENVLCTCPSQSPAERHDEEFPIVRPNAESYLDEVRRRSNQVPPEVIDLE